MNKNQKIVLCIGLVVFILMGLFLNSFICYRYWIMDGIVTAVICYLIKDSKDWRVSKETKETFWGIVAVVFVLAIVILIILAAAYANTKIT